MSPSVLFPAPLKVNPVLAPGVLGRVTTSIAFQIPRTLMCNNGPLWKRPLIALADRV